METSKEEFVLKKKLHRKKTGRQVAWMIYEYSKVSDTVESVLDLNEIWKVELKSDIVQSIITRWDEIIIAMKKQPDDEMLGTV